MTNRLENIELKPCPFCGGDAILSHRLDEDIWTHNTVKWYKIECSGCDVKTKDWPESGAEEEVIEVWNRRVYE